MKNDYFVVYILEFLQQIDDFFRIFFPRKLEVCELRVGTTRWNYVRFYVLICV